MKQYLDYLRDVREHGVLKGDRTGTGTYSVFGRMLRFDLAQGFPIVTTKFVHFKSIVYELLWFLSGDTNVRYLQAHGVTIWNEWVSESGDLGAVYGHQWMHWGAKPKAIVQPVPQLRADVKATYLGVASGRGKENHPLKKTWEGMIARCYDKNSIEYPHYGARGVYVSNDWLEFSKFAEDAQKLPGWLYKKQHPRKYVLDKDGVGNGFVYSATSCQWVTPSENQQLKSDKLYIVEKDGQQYTFTNPTQFCRDVGIPDGNFSDLWTGRKNAHVRHGYRLVDVIDRDVGINQLEKIVQTLRENPNDRRIILEGWNVGQLDLMALPPCHKSSQYYVADGKLSCMMYQRSVDSLLGLPFNIAQYALLTHMIAQQTDLDVGELVWVGGDCHIYANHINQVDEQLTREPYPLPTLNIKRRPDSLFLYEYEDFELVGYQHHPAIKAPVAV